MGKWKLLHGHQVYLHGSAVGNICTSRTGVGRAAGSTFPLPVPANESNPWCDFGWTPPPKSDGQGGDATEAPRFPADGSTNCTTLPCAIGLDSPYIAGGTLLFDVVADMYEEHNVAAAHPDVVRQLLARLQQYNDSHCGGKHCDPVNKQFGPSGTPTNVSDPRFESTPVWLPWRGNPVPAVCDTDIRPPAGPSPTPGPAPGPAPAPTPSEPCGGDGEVGDGRITLLPGHPGKCLAQGWCSGAQYSGPARQVYVTVDGDVVATAVANESRPTAGPHGFSVAFSCAAFDHGNHSATVGCKCSDAEQVQVLRGGRVCTTGPPARVVPC